MNIVNLSFNHIPDFKGPEDWLKRIDFSIGILESLQRYGSVSAIYNTNFKGELVRNGVVFHFPAFSRRELLFPVRFGYFIRKLQPHVILVHGINTPFQLSVLHKILGPGVTTIVVHHAEQPLRDFRRYFQHLADRNTTAYIFASASLAKPWLESHLIVDEKKIHERIVSSSRFAPLDRAVARAVTGITGNLCFLWVGRLNENKDPLTVVRSFIRLLKHKPEARLYMIYQSEELLPVLLQEITKAGVNHAVLLIGKKTQEELPYWYSSNSFFISGSHYESSGIAVCEAMASGCIPVLSAIPSFATLTGQGRIGFSFQAGSEEQLCEVLLKAIDVDQATHRQRVLDHFAETLSFDALAKRLMEII